MVKTEIDKEFSKQLHYPSKFVEVRGAKIHYVEAGEGDAILFLHGIPTSSYVWRHVMPYLAGLGRCIAPDLVGFGQSDKPDIEYSVLDHIAYLSEFIQQLNLKNITFIMHGWGSVIGLHYAMQHEDQCKGLVFYEAFLRSLNGESVSLPFQEQLIALQSLENASDWVADGSVFVDKIIPQHVMRQLTDEEMQNYRQPFLQKGAEKPIIQYLRELQNSDGKNKVAQLIADYSDKLTHSPLPKLMLYSVPGFMTTMATIMWAKTHLPHLEIADMGEELHLAQETHPELIGETISVWLQGAENK